MNLEALDIFELEDSVTLAVHPVQLASYDFGFRQYFRCRSLVYGTDKAVIARVGAIDDYPKLYSDLGGIGIRLIHSPDEHHRCASIAGWGPRIVDLTPETWLADTLPPANEVEERFGWPVFIKGDRQTSRHRADLSIARGAEDYARIAAAWGSDHILSWQRPAIRRFINLRRVGDRPEGIQASFEFRVFCWRGQMVAFGAYWGSHLYTASADDTAQLQHLAELAATRVDVPFLVVDVAQTTEGQWIVVECNDAQESSYGGALPLQLWQRVAELERVK